jgi:four helix bundle protein
MSYEERYKKLVVWQNAQELRRLIYEVTADFPKSEFKRIAQMRDAARSVKQNIQEGRKRVSELEFLRFLDIVRASLAELYGDVEDCREDLLLSEDLFQKLQTLIRKTDFLFHRLMLAVSKTKKAGKAQKAGKAENAKTFTAF